MTEAPNWFLVTVVGSDRPGIVAKLTQALYRGGCNLGEATMSRLGGVFAVLLMVNSAQSRDAIEALVAPVAAELGLRLHVDPIAAHRHLHAEPNVQVTVYGADRPGIVAQVTALLAGQGVNILDLSSEVGGTTEEPLYIMIIDAHAPAGCESLEAALAKVRGEGVVVRVDAQHSLIG